MKMTNAIVALCVAASALAVEKMASKPSVFRPNEIQWAKGPASLPQGAMMVVMEGDPASEGPFAIRFKFPDKYRVAPHWHPKTERVTVIAGTLHLGMGEKFDEAATQSLSAGTFGFWPAEMRHFAWFEGETILQLHGIGPWQINYVNPGDDPRNQKR
jgi:hypothetical protein